MRNKFVLVLAITVLTSNASLAQTAKAEVQFKEAQQKELVEGDLKAAIKEYAKIAGGRDRALAAQALLRMAECYTKLGDAEAREVYERLVRDFSDQPAAVAVARARLGNQGAGQSGGGAVDLQLAQKLGGRSYGPGISRDGRYIAFSGGQGIGVHDLMSSEVRILSSTQVLTRNYLPLVSPDGKQVAAAMAGPGNGVQIQLFSTDGKNNRILTTQAYAAFPLNWSADGRYLVAYVIASSGTYEDGKIALLSVADGAQKVVGPADSFQLAGGVGFQPRISPDGRYIAYGRFGRKEKRDLNIYMRTVDGGPEMLLAENVVSGLTSSAWTADGRRLIFNDDSDLWSLSVEDGRPVGRPVRVKKGVGKLLGIAESGDLFFQRRDETMDTYVANLDLATGKLAGAPRTDAAADPYASNGLAGIYPSPDGRYIARVHAAGASIEVTLSTETSETRKLALSGIPASLQWFPDSNSMLWQKADGGLYQLNIHTGESRRLLDSVIDQAYRDSGGTYGRAVTLAPDGHTIYYLRRDPNSKETIILASDVVQGGSRELARMREDIPGGLSIAPDGGRLAFLAYNRGGAPSVMTIPASGGQARTILTRADIARVGGVLVNGVVWSGDGRRLLFIQQGQLGQPGDVLSISADGGEPQPLGLGLHAIVSLNIDPAGKQISFNDIRSMNELWVTKELLNDTKK